MSFLRDIAFAAAGYGASELINSKKDKVQEDKNLEELILDYAHKHDVWGRNQDFYNKLLKIADQFYDPYA